MCDNCGMWAFLPRDCEFTLLFGSKRKAMGIDPPRVDTLKRNGINRSRNFYYLRVN